MSLTLLLYAALLLICGMVFRMRYILLLALSFAISSGVIFNLEQFPKTQTIQRDVPTLNRFIWGSTLYIVTHDGYIVKSDSFGHVSDPEVCTITRETNFKGRWIFKTGTFRDYIMGCNFGSPELRLEHIKNNPDYGKTIEGWKKIQNEKNSI